MIDVYKDMEECKGFVTELADKVFDIFMMKLDKR